MAKKRQLYLDMRGCLAAANWPSNNPRFPQVIPIRPGRHQCDFDVCEEKLQGWRAEYERLYPPKDCPEWLHTIRSKMPIGLDYDALPAGARILVALPLQQQQVAA